MIERNDIEFNPSLEYDKKRIKQYLNEQCESAILSNILVLNVKPSKKKTISHRKNR